MLQKSLANIIILLYLFQLINCQTKFYEPRQRFGHTAAVLDDNKLYMFGGYDMTSSIEYLLGKEFFYIDFSTTFNTKELTWEDLSDYYTLPSHAFSATVKSNRNNNTLFLYGGIIESTAETLVYRYDTQSNAWSTPTITGINNIRKRDLIGIIDNNGKMYLWSGMKVINEKNTNYVNDMLILDTINLSWGQGSTIGAPTARGNYGAILLPNNNIIYMGGYNGEELTLNQVYLYDIINDNWSIKTTSGIVPSGRSGFSAVLGLDGQRIIIFGGTTTVARNNLTIEDSLYELNLINFEWRIPKFSGQIPKSRMYHKANVIEKYMVVSFGLGYDPPIESDILLLDISNNNEYIWTYNFVPSYNPDPSSLPSSSIEQSSSPTQSSSPSHSVNLLSAQQSEKSSLTMIVSIVGSLFGGTLLLFGCFFIYRWIKIKREQKN
ncbi:unnamed protein product [Rhizophagus irregularis]|nr:unnamed protein product [Rhizophagus irregularis]CAB5378311.1 unnamed protein product [Rhizophagus irregularis]